MNDNVNNAITNLVDFNEEELAVFKGLLKQRKIKKNDFLLKAGDLCKAMVIISSGGLRFFSLTAKGEQSHWFAFEGEWLGDYESFLSRQPSIRKSIAGKKL